MTRSSELPQVPISCTFGRPDANIATCNNILMNTELPYQISTSKVLDEGEWMVLQKQKKNKWLLFSLFSLNINSIHKIFKKLLNVLNKQKLSNKIKFTIWHDKKTENKKHYSKRNQTTPNILFTGSIRVSKKKIGKKGKYTAIYTVVWPLGALASNSFNDTHLASRGFSLACLLAFTNMFAWLVCRLVGMFTPHFPWGVNKLTMRQTSHVNE